MQSFFLSIYRFVYVTTKAAMFSLCCIFTVQAQQYGFLNFTTDNGLAQSQVTGMCQDDYGYLWFSTFGGVSRFDGLEYQNFATNDGLLNNQVQSVFHDSKNRIWFGCMGGYSTFNKGKFYSHTFKNQLSQANIVDIKETENSGIWLLFENAYLVNVKNNTHIVYEIPDTNITESRSFVLQDKAFLIATNNGVVKFDYTTKRFVLVPEFGEKNCSFIAVKKNLLALATTNDGVYVYTQHQQVQHITTKHGLIDDAVRHLFFDAESGLWVSTISGVSVLKKNVVTSFNSVNGLVNNNIRFTGQDNEGNIWFGTDGKGIMKFTGKSVLNYTAADGLAGDLVMSILQDKNHNFWFATYGNGVSFFDGKKFKTYNDAGEIANDIVWTLAQTSDGTIWMGTSNGLTAYDGKKFWSFDETKGLTSTRITSLYVDKHDRLWIGNRAGLNYLEGDKITAVENAGIQGGNIRCILPDKEGNLWLGSRAGLYCFDGKRSILYRFNKKDEDNTVYCLRFDEHGSLWVGTREGLYQFTNGIFKRINFANDLVSGNINFLMDDKDKLWFGTNNGIFELKLNEYYNNDTLIVKSFGRNEGLKGRETNMNAVYKDRQNNLWFGTDGGLVKIGEKRFSTDANSLPFVHINDIKIFFEKPNWAKISKKPLNEFGFPTTASVKYSQNHFTFYFTGISHTQPQKLRYRFMLEGFDQSWLPITETRYVTYSNLPPGSYTFKVLAQNANGLWSANPAVFTFTVIAPFWRTWWFYSLCVVLFLLAIFALWQLRLRQLKRKNETMQLQYKSKLLSLEQQSLNASMNRHFIFNSLNSIQYYINKQDKLEANRYLTNFAKLIRKNLDSSISSDLIPLSEELERIKLYLSLENMRFKDRFEYVIEIAPGLNPESISIPPMLFQPYLENSIWHGILPKEDYMGTLTVRIFPKEDNKDLVVIEIEDDGIGLSASLANKTNTGSTHISRGIEITSGRLNLLKKVTNQDLEIVGPMDITDASGKTTGTLVRLVISVKYPINDKKSSQKLHEN